MKVLIDADGCPVVKLTTRLAKQSKMKVLIFCDSSHHFESQDAKVITVVKGRDAVDFELLKHMEKEDIVVTQDYGLAAMVLSKGGIAINHNGLVYTEENIDQLLFSRYQNFKIRKSGGRIRGPRKRNRQNDHNFSQAFKWLQKKE